MRKRNIKLYNVIFPLWLLWIFPMTWVIVLPINFLIDYLVVALTMKHLKIENIKEQTFRVIWKVWIFGFLADFIGTALMFAVNIIEFERQPEMGRWWIDHVANPVSFNPYESIYGVLWVVVCVLITAVIIYFFNRKICLKKLELSEEVKRKIALSMAVFTAPYLFFLPTAWFY